MQCPDLKTVLETPKTILGKGAKGVVYKVGNYVLKIIKLVTESDKKLYEGETSTLDALSKIESLKPYLPAFCWTKYDEASKTGYILQKFEPTVTLDYLIKAFPEASLKFEIGGSIFNQLAKGVLELLKAGYLHRDIKPENILIRVESAKKMKIPIFIDFGLACPIETCKDAIKAGTPSFMVPNFLPPQVHQRQPKMRITRNSTMKNVYVKTKLINMYSSKETDLYALALTLEELMPIIDFTGHRKEEVSMRTFIEDKKKAIFLNTLRKRRNAIAQREGLGNIHVVEGGGTVGQTLAQTPTQTPAQTAAAGTALGGKRRRTQKNRRAST